MQEIYKHDELITLELSNQQLGPNLEIACKINQNKVQSFDRNIKEEDRLEPFIPSTVLRPTQRSRQFQVSRTLALKNY
jgi:hypothetical protein